MNDDEEIEIVDEDAGATDKVAKIKKVLEVCRTEKEEYLLGWQRAKADYINAERAFSDRLQEATRVGKISVIQQFLEVVDSLDHALADSSADSKWIEGIRLTYDKCRTILKQHGIVEMESIGKEFDPRFHEAIEMIDAKNESEDHKIAHVFQRGYLIGERVLRPAKVKVLVYKNNQ